MSAAVCDLAFSWSKITWAILKAYDPLPPFGQLLTPSRQKLFTLVSEKLSGQFLIRQGAEQMAQDLDNMVNGIEPSIRALRLCS